MVMVRRSTYPFGNPQPRRRGLVRGTRAEESARTKISFQDEARASEKSPPEVASLARDGRYRPGTASKTTLLAGI